MNSYLQKRRGASVHILLHNGAFASLASGVNIDL